MAWGLLLAGMLAGIARAAAPADATAPANDNPSILTNAASVRDLPPDLASRRLPVRLRGLVTYSFYTNSCFVQDETAGIYVGNGAQFAAVTVGDVVVVEGVSSPGEYAPIIEPASVRVPRSH